MKQPLKNLKFCSTSVPSDIRLEMVSKIKAMGGEHFSHLMSDVDILIVGDRDTDKYKYSVKNRLDIKFVRPKSIYAMYDNWVKGDDVSIDELPVFDGLNICISRVTDSRQKKLVMHLIKQHEGLLTDSLTINNTCVIASERSGKRYEKALEWEIPVVHPQWIIDSVRRGAALEYTYYDISQDKEIGVGACLCWDALDKPSKRTLEEEEERTVKVAKRENKIWNNIMGNVKPPTLEAIRDTAWDDADIELDDHSINKFQLRKRPEQQKPEEEEEKSQLFLGFNFGLYGFEDPIQISKLNKVIRSHSGDVTERIEEDVSTMTHLLIPSTKTLDVTNITRNYDIKVVTEWFIERSLHYNTIKHDKWGLPLKHLDLKLNLKICISGFTGIELLHTIKLIKLLGCEYCDTLTLKRDLLVINLAIIGLTRDNSPKLFSYKYPELISCSDSNKAGITSTKNKINASKKWNIPIVSLAFLMEATDTGFLPELLDHQWCIFAPRDLAKPRNLMEYVKKLGTTREEEDSLTVPKLPSPMKKKKKNWGRLIGRARESQMGKDFLDSDALDEPSPAPDLSTQISYNYNEGNDGKRAKRDTRNHLKELNHL